MRINIKKTVGLIIDMQERLFPHIHEYQKISENTQILIKGLKALEVPILVTEQYTKGLGPTVAPLRQALGDAETVEKMAFSCCDDANFMCELAPMEMQFVVLAGIESHVCVLQTTLDLLRNGYHPVVVEDCVSSRKPNDKKIAIERMRNEGAIITTYESVLFELTRYSDHPNFKTISKLVK